MVPHGRKGEAAATFNPAARRRARGAAGCAPHPDQHLHSHSLPALSLPARHLAVLAVPAVTAHHPPVRNAHRITTPSPSTRRGHIVYLPSTSPSQRHTDVTPRGHLLPPSQSGSAHGDITSTEKRWSEDTFISFCPEGRCLGLSLPVPAAGLFSAPALPGGSSSTFCPSPSWAQRLTPGWMKVASRAQRGYFAPYVLVSSLSRDGCLNPCPWSSHEGLCVRPALLRRDSCWMPRSIALSPKSSFGSRFSVF